MQVSGTKSKSDGGDLKKLIAICSKVCKRKLLIVLSKRLLISDVLICRAQGAAKALMPRSLDIFYQYVNFTSPLHYLRTHAFLFVQQLRRSTRTDTKDYKAITAPLDTDEDDLKPEEKEARARRKKIRARQEEKGLVESSSDGDGNFEPDDDSDDSVDTEDLLNCLEPETQKEVRQVVSKKLKSQKSKEKRAVSAQPRHWSLVDEFRLTVNFAGNEVLFAPSFVPEDRLDVAESSWDSREAFYKTGPPRFIKFKIDLGDGVPVDAVVALKRDRTSCREGCVEVKGFLQTGEYGMHKVFSPRVPMDVPAVPLKYMLSTPLDLDPKQFKFLKAIRQMSCEKTIDVLGAPYPNDYNPMLHHIFVPGSSTVSTAASASGTQQEQNTEESNTEEPNTNTEEPNTNTEEPNTEESWKNVAAFFSQFPAPYSVGEFDGDADFDGFACEVRYDDEIQVRYTSFLAILLSFLVFVFFSNYSEPFHIRLQEENSE